MHSPISPSGQTNSLQSQIDYSTLSADQLTQMLDARGRPSHGWTEIYDSIAQRIATREPGHEQALQRVLSWVGIENSVGEKMDSANANHLLKGIFVAGDDGIKSLVVHGLKSLPASHDAPFRVAESERLQVQFLSNEEQRQAKLLDMLMSKETEIQSVAVEIISERVYEVDWLLHPHMAAGLDSKERYLEPLVPGLLNAVAAELNGTYKWLGMLMPMGPALNVFSIFSALAEENPRLAVALLDRQFVASMMFSVHIGSQNHPENIPIASQPGTLSLFQNNGRLSPEGNAALLIFENVLKDKIPNLAEITAEYLLRTSDGCGTGISDFARYGLESFKPNVASQVVPVLLRETVNVPDIVVLSLASTMIAEAGRGAITAVLNQITENCGNELSIYIRVLNSIAANSLFSRDGAKSEHVEELKSDSLKEKLAFVRAYACRTEDTQLIDDISLLEAKIAMIGLDPSEAL